jgi:large conductance mechanosensitive channel
MLADYKAFLFRGNLLDLAVAFILGVAFSSVVTSFTNDVIMATIAALFGQPTFDGITIPLGNGEILIGSFITALVNFLIVATVMFLIVRAASRFQRPAVEETPAPESDEVVILREIRDALRTR